MRAYSTLDEEALRSRDLLQDWKGEGLLSPTQYECMEQETPCELRRTNIFLRIVLFVFTLVVLGAANALFFNQFLPGAAESTNGSFLLMLSAICYTATEIAVSRAKLYRHGIEEALAVCSVAFLSAGLNFGFHSHAASAIPAAAGAVASFWVWYRFGQLPG